jgi:decaprenylphospho-beta-D-erythro-pentofuranosid-2-ulose 2-reductase
MTSGLSAARIPGDPTVGAPPATRTLLVGGSSEIGLAIVSRLRRDGAVHAYLLGRDGARLQEASATLQRAGVQHVLTGQVEAADLADHHRAVADAFDGLGGVDVVVLAVGVLGGQAGLDANPDEAAEVMQVNFLGAGSLMLECLRRLRAQGRGTLIVLSTAAVERPRASNPIYGAAKSGLDALAQSLGDATAGTGVRVLVVRPGFVHTRMTAGLKPAPMSTTADEVAHATVRALSGRAHTIWVPARLRWIFAFLRHMPRGVFRRLGL